MHLGISNILILVKSWIIELSQNGKECTDKMIRNEAAPAASVKYLVHIEMNKACTII